MRRRQAFVSKSHFSNAAYLLDKANEFTTFVRKQKQRTSQQSARQQWLLTTAKHVSQGAQVENDLLSLLAELSDEPSLHTQLLVLRQEWSELHQDLLTQAGQDVQILQLQPPHGTAQQQRSELIAAVKSLDCAYHTARADLLAVWPTALESPALQDELLQDCVVQLCRQYSAAAKNVKQELQDAASHLQADFQCRLEVWHCDMCKLESNQFSRKHSTWSQQDQDLLAQMSQQFVSNVAASTKDCIYGYMAAMLPGKSVHDIARHNDWQWRKRMLDSRRQDLLCAWKKAHKAFLSDASKTLQQSVQQQATSAESAAERLKVMTAQQGLHDQLKVMRCERYVAEALRAADLEAEEQALAERQEEEAREQQLRAQQNKQQLALYHAALAAARAEAQANAELHAQEDALQARVQSQANQERVTYRQAETAHKEQLKLEKALWLQQEQQDREDRLDRLRAQVQVDVNTDPERTRAATIASSAQEAEHAAAFAPVHGYTTESLLRDKRFKVLEALRQQSLHNTGYARHALLAVSPATQPRRDMLPSGMK